MIEDLNWQKLTGEDYIKAVTAVNSVLQSQEHFAVQNAVMQIKSLPFYQNFKLLQAMEIKSWPRYVINFLYSSHKIIKLDHSAKPISQANLEAPLELNQINLASYLKFFFSSVRGQNNEAFYLIEKITDLPLKADSADETKEKIAQYLIPLISTQKENGNFEATALIVHQNNLYNAKINITPDGKVDVLEETTILSDLPIQNNMLK